MKKLFFLTLGCFVYQAAGAMDLYSAARVGNAVRVAELLKAENVGVNQKNARGLTPLLYAAAQGHEAIVRLFLEYNAYVNLPNKYGNTPLKCAVTQAVVRLLEAGLMREQQADAARLAFCCVLNQRAGASSNARVLYPQLVYEIVRYVQPSDFQGIAAPLAAASSQTGMQQIIAGAENFLGNRHVQMGAAAITLVGFALWRVIQR